jgi:hypothetical protein
VAGPQKYHLSVGPPILSRRQDKYYCFAEIWNRFAYVSFVYEKYTPEAKVVEPILEFHPAVLLNFPKTFRVLP